MSAIILTPFHSHQSFFFRGKILLPPPCCPSIWFVIPSPSAIRRKWSPWIFGWRLYSSMPLMPGWWLLAASWLRRLQERWRLKSRGNNGLCCNVLHEHVVVVVVVLVVKRFEFDLGSVALRWITGIWCGNDVCFDFNLITGFRWEDLFSLLAKANAWHQQI